MADMGDDSQAFALGFQAGALAHHRATQPYRDGSGTCVDCGESIPSERRDAVPDAIRCAACQEDFEGAAR